MASFNELHEHLDVVRKTLTEQEKQLQMEGKSENQHGDITREFLAERGLKEKDWYGTASAGDIQELDLVELLSDHMARVKRIESYKESAEIRKLETQINDYKKTFLRVRNFLANVKVNDAAGKDEQKSLFYAINEYLKP